MPDRVLYRDDQLVEIQLNVLVFEEGEYFVAYCPSLELSSYGNSIQDAKEGFDEAMRSFIEDSQKAGTLKKDLEQHGWIFSSARKIEQPQQVDLDIPAGLLKKQFNDNWKLPVY